MPSDDPHFENARNEESLVVRTDFIPSLGSFSNFATNETSDRAAIIQSTPGAGLTFFLKSLNQQIPGDFRSFYVSGADKGINSFFNQVFTQILSNKSDKKRFTTYIARQKGAGQVSNALRSLAVCIPVVGPAFGIVEHSGEKQVASFTNDINMLNLGAEYLATLANEHPVIVCLDIDEDDLSKAIMFIERFASDVFQNIRFLIGIPSRSDRVNIDRLVVALEQFAMQYKQVSFPRPSASFVKALYRAHGLRISDLEAQDITSNGSRQIYGILRSIYALKKSQSIGDVVFSGLEHAPSALELKVLSYLIVAEQALPESELVELLLMSEDLFIEDAHSLRPTIDNLANLGVVSVYDLAHDRSISLTPSQTSVAVANETSRVDYLLVSRQLFDYFDRKFDPEAGTSSLKYAALLYRLAAICDQGRRPEFGRSLLRYSVLMQNFTELEPKLVNILAQDDATVFENFVLSQLYKVSAKDYLGAAEGFARLSNPEWRDRHPCLVLEAICNNRLRVHARADNLLQLAASSANSLEESVVLHGYRIANFLHWGRPMEARNHYVSVKGDCEKAANFGYLKRNAAAAFERRTKLQMEMEAVEFFREEKHHYGQYSSMVNAGATQMAMDHYDKADALLLEARPELEKYGIQNSVIVAFNIMAVAVFDGDIAVADKLLERFTRLPDHNLAMTEMYTLFYRNLLAFRKGDQTEASAGVRALQELVHSSKMPRGKERLYANNLALGMGLKLPNQEIEDMIKAARKWPDMRDPITTERVVGKGEVWLGSDRACEPEEVMELLCPPYFAYWYMDEISLLSRAWFAT